MLGLFFNIFFVIFIAFLCIFRYKGYCGSCDKKKRIPDIIQILLITLYIIFFVGALLILKLMLFVLVSYVIRVSFENKGKTSQKTEECGSNCIDPWKE